MTTSRRKFLKNISAFGLGLGVSGSIAAHEEINFELFDKLKSFNPNQTDETFWNLIKQAYTTSSSIMNLNNGGVSPQPKVVQDAFERYNQLSNEAPSYYMWRILDKGRESLRQKLAKLAGCNAEELVINRNTT